MIVTTKTIALRVTQPRRQPAAPQRSVIAGMSSPLIMMAGPLPTTMMPAARPRHRRENQ